MLRYVSAHRDRVLGTRLLPLPAASSARVARLRWPPVPPLRLPDSQYLLGGLPPPITTVQRPDRLLVPSLVLSMIAERGVSAHLCQKYTRLISVVPIYLQPRSIPSFPFNSFPYTSQEDISPARHGKNNSPLRLWNLSSHYLKSM